MAFFEGQPAKPAPEGHTFWISMKQDMIGGIGISWTICKSFALCSKQITMPAPWPTLYNAEF